ncbi:acetyltransferase [Mycobacterium sp. Root265]|uniref:GNAT family N-acetyltransferase n=1 Tax=Mycobacterium sp. Root265 TaxID=1736504 RepID=UPI00070DCAE5|nr:GNAT family N-acetyltransferase [Mycobacterium sp. Root265]KRD07751.1 acetyltransferase [Mycobacterium sp. Root265]
MSADHTDSTGAQAIVAAGDNQFTISVDGRQVGLIDFYDRDGVRTFTHTEVDPAFGGRGLATILVAEALQAARAADLRIASHCSMVTQYIGKHPEYQG